MVAKLELLIGTSYVVCGFCIANSNLALKKAKLAFEHVIDGNVGTPDKLFWQERSKKGKKQKEIYPVRVVPPQETVGLGLRAWNDNTHSAVQYVQFPHSCMTDLSKYDAVSKRSMCPYYGAGKAKDRWCPAKFEQYSKQLKKKHRKLTALDIKAEELFLQCVLEKSLEEGESEKKMAEVDEAVPSESAAVNADDKAEEDAVESEDVSEDEGGIGRGGRPSRRSAGKMQEEKREWLRVGDRIGYFNQTCTAGDMSGYEESIIRYVDPKGERILTLDDPMTNLLPTHLVKRVQMNIRGKLVKNKDAAFRAINTYTMKKEGNPNALRDGLAERTKRVHATMQKHKENTIAAMKEDGCFMGEDFFR